jgi:SpoVK/Ycf46/Vps4 family AAA+-type ATPase
VGKSFSARIIAGELSARSEESWSLYTVDLGRIMSKYVGETEQNINALLNGIEGRRAILQIDEADGLLGRRGEISDARDNFANVMVSHLLSRLERHRGPVILTTNLRSNIDSAFLRRFQLVIDFPMPGEEERRSIWDRLLPRDRRHEELTSELLAESVQLSPGSILNATVYATVLAAEEGGPVGLRHVARAVRAELGKENRQVRRTEMGALADCIEEEGA